MDMDGFSVKHVQFKKGELPDIPIRSRKAQFLCREASIIILGHRGTISKSVFFSIPKQHYPTNDFRTIRYATLRLHGLDIQPTNTERPLYEQSALGRVMLDWYHLVQQVTHLPTPTIAYKGGIVERDLLNSLNIPSVNLEDWGCPKADRLVQWFPFVKQHHHQCHRQNHLQARLQPGEIIHCPQWEIALFAEYIFMIQKERALRQTIKRSWSTKATLQQAK